MSKLLYDGPAGVYLEGEKALWFIGDLKRDVITYAVGSVETPIIIHDFRSTAVEAAFKTNTDQGQREFADNFNQSSWVRIKEHVDQIEIDLNEYEQMEAKTVLWLGVIHDGEMPVHRVLWQRLQPVGETSVAFVVLTND